MENGGEFKLKGIGEVDSGNTMVKLIRDVVFECLFEFFEVDDLGYGRLFK